MWTSTIDLDFKKLLLTQLIGRFYHNIYFSSYSPLQVQNLPRQSLPETSWVRVRNRLSGICGSDLHLIYADGDIRIAPVAVPGHKYLYPGHELVGEVIEIGKDVQRLHVGDRVVLQSGPNCLAAGIQPLCRFCMARNYNLCENSAACPQPIGGGWSEEMLIHEQHLFQIPATLNDEQAVMLEPTAVAVHAVLRRLPKAGERVLIIGAGTIGLSILQIVRALAPQSEISVLARHPFQVERATRLGAAHIIYPYDAYVGIKRATQAKLYQGNLGNQTLSGGYDIIYDTVGHRKTLHHALRWTRAQGTIVLVGIDLHMMHLDLTPIWFQEINLLGSTSHGMETWPDNDIIQRSTFSIALELMEQGRIAPEQLITHHFALNNYKHALLTTTHKAESRAIKVLFDYSLLPASVVPNVRASAPRHRHITVNFNRDYPDSEKKSIEQNIAEPQKKELPHEPRPNSTTGRKPDTLYGTKIQDTPPIRSFAKELPASFISPASAEPDDDENDDTASSIPVVEKDMPAPTQTDSDQQHSLQTTSTAIHEKNDHALPSGELPTPHINDSYQVLPLEPLTPLIDESSHQSTTSDSDTPQIDGSQQDFPPLDLLELYTPEHYDLSLQSPSSAASTYEVKHDAPLYQPVTPTDEEHVTTHPELAQDTHAEAQQSTEENAEGPADPSATNDNEPVAMQADDHLPATEADTEQAIQEQTVVDEAYDGEQHTRSRHSSR